jgi:hypothetical protein
MEENHLQRKSRCCLLAEPCSAALPPKSPQTEPDRNTPDSDNGSYPYMAD